MRRAAARAASSARSAPRRRSRRGGGAWRAVARVGVGSGRHGQASLGEVRTEGRRNCPGSRAGDHQGKPGTRPGPGRAYAGPSDVGERVAAGRTRARARGRVAGAGAPCRRSGGVRGAGGRAGDRQDAAARRAGRATRRVAAAWCSAGARRSSSATRPTASGSTRSTRTCRRWTRRGCDGWPATSSTRWPWRCPRSPTSRGAPAPPAERYVVHRAMRGLLERLAGARRLVLCLDDVHWADPASLELLAALARRPPEGAVLLAVAYREGQAPGALVAALGDAVRAARAERLAPAPLSRAEAAALCGGDVAAGAVRAQRRQPVLSRAARARATRRGCRRRARAGRRRDSRRRRGRAGRRARRAARRGAARARSGGGRRRAVRARARRRHRGPGRGGHAGGAGRVA